MIPDNPSCPHRASCPCADAAPECNTTFETCAMYACRFTTDVSPKHLVDALAMATLDTNTVVDTLQHATDAFNRVKSAFFWTPGGTAESRRRQEEELSHHAVLRFRMFTQLTRKVRVDEYLVRIHLEVHMSCKNVYVTRNTFINDKATNLTAIKGLMNRLGAPNAHAVLHEPIGTHA